MSDAISFAEIEDQSVQLLPARTVLSLLPAAITGPYGEPGQGQLAKAQQATGTTWMVLFGYDPADQPS
jgi:hypothetical protein